MLRIPPPLWTIFFIVGLYALNHAPGLNSMAPFGHGVLGAAVCALGLALPMIGALQFRAAGTQILPTSERNDKLVTTGLYALTRNPMYLGMVVLALGAAIYFGRPLMYIAPVLVFAVANFVFIPFEEAKMARQFGDAFEAYRRRVRRWI